MAKRNQSSGGGDDGAITPGLAQVEQAVKFTNTEVLAPTQGLPNSIMPKYKLSPKDLENLTTYLFALPD